MSWTASTDNVGVTPTRSSAAGRELLDLRADRQHDAHELRELALTATTTYGYRVRASDSAGNLGPYSDPATATTLTAPSVATPRFMQGNYATPQSAKSSVAVTYPIAQAGGDLNVVVAGWNFTTASVTSVTDTAGNVYTAATPIISSADGLVWQTIYYAKNIVPVASNVVTVKFNVSVDYPDVRILEYHGMDPTSPLDAAIGAAGTNATCNSGSLVTTSSNPELLVAGNVVQTMTSGPGPGYTNRFLTSPNGDLLEDRVVTTPGSYNATAPLAAAGSWVMQLAAFKAGPIDTTPPVASVTAPASGSALTGTVTVSVTATDGAAVQGVQLLVDGAVVGLTDTTSPYSFSFDTTKFSNGAHALSAAAVDLDQNTGTAPPISVTFSNTTPATRSRRPLVGADAAADRSVNAALFPT